MSSNARRRLMRDFKRLSSDAPEGIVYNFTKNWITLIGNELMVVPPVLLTISTPCVTFY